MSHRFFTNNSNNFYQDLHQALCQIKMPQLCGMCETTMQAHAGAMMSDERTMRGQNASHTIHGHMTFPQWLLTFSKFQFMLFLIICLDGTLFKNTVNLMVEF